MTSEQWLGAFDAIDTSNVIDYVGLANVLLVCRPLISPSGVLSTTSMTVQATQGGDGNYLKTQLFLDKKLWPDVYGWHCDASQWCFQMFEIPRRNGDR